MSTPKKNTKTKTLLKVNPVSSGHWSSGKAEEDIRQTKCVVQIIKASQLLASDAETGKSDPVCFMKFCPQYSKTPDWKNFASPESGILSTTVIPACTDPIWNSYHTFPLILESYQELLNASIHLLIRDEDQEEDGSTSYEDLGQVQIHLKESIKIAKVAQRHNKNIFLGAPVWHTLEKCPGMRKKDGKILVSVSIHFEDSDTKTIQKETGAKNLVELMSKYKADANANDSTSAFSTTSAASRTRKKSSSALTPRVASPVRLFNDGSKTPLLELSIPEEKMPRKNRDSVGQENNNKVDNNDSNRLSGQNVSTPMSIENNGKDLSGNDNRDDDGDDVLKTLEAVQSEEFDMMADMEKLSALNHVAEKTPTEDGQEEKEEKNQTVEPAVTSQSDDDVAAAVETAKAKAEAEAARTIARAKADIVAAKEAAKRQLEIDDAIKQATQQVERATAAKVKQLQKEAEKEAKISLQAKEEEDTNRHEGDLYWDENDNIAGGNDITRPKDLSNASVEPPESNAPDEDALISDNTGINREKESSPPSSPTPKSPSSRKSKIPKLKKSSSSSSSTSSQSQPSPSGDTKGNKDNGPAKNTETKAQAEKRKRAEARARIRQGKKNFKVKQAEDEANGTLMEFISLEEPTGGNEQLPPRSRSSEAFNLPATGGDETLPDMNDDDASVASTTVDEEEFSPRKSASFPGQGSRPDTIRALREISQQREAMDKALAELQRSSEEKFAIVQKQLSDFKATGEYERYPDESHDFRNDQFLKKSNQFFPTQTERSLNSRTGHSGDHMDTRAKIATILQNGDMDDIGMMLEKFQAEYTEVLSLATRAQLFEYVSLLLRRGKFKDSCLNWVVALLNTSTGENLVQNLPEHTCKAIVQALVVVSSEPSNRGILAATLEAQIFQQCS